MVPVAADPRLRQLPQAPGQRALQLGPDRVAESPRPCASETTVGAPWKFPQNSLERFSARGEPASWQARHLPYCEPGESAGRDACPTVKGGSSHPIWLARDALPARVGVGDRRETAFRDDLQFLHPQWQFPKIPPRIFTKGGRPGKASPLEGSSEFDALPRSERAGQRARPLTSEPYPIQSAGVHLVAREACCCRRSASSADSVTRSLRIHCSSFGLP